MEQPNQSRCKNHALRGAVAKCMSCLGFFCRECVVEHDGRMLCKHCLDQHRDAGQSVQNRPLLRMLCNSALLCVSVLFCYLYFYLIGRSLMSIAQTFYDSTP